MVVGHGQSQGISAPLAKAHGAANHPSTMDSSPVSNMLLRFKEAITAIWKTTTGRVGVVLALVLLLLSPALAQVPKAIQNALGLDSQMNVYYADTLGKYLIQFRRQHPIILGLFSDSGGDFYLYKPGVAEPIKAPPVPVQYQVVKGVSHSSMALYAILQPYMDGLSTDTAWKGSFAQYRSEMATTLAGVKDMGLKPEVADTVTTILKGNIAFIDSTLAAGTIDKAKVDAWAKAVAPNFETTIAAAADYQVGHWMTVMSQWKKELGSQWDQTYGATNSLYVTRRNNILFTLMAQFFGPDAINDRLMLFETTEFTTTPDAMLSLISRIVKDRELGQSFFNNYFLMDVELLSTGARKAIQNADGAGTIRPGASMGSYTAGPAHKRIAAFDKANGITPLMPPLAPFETHEWPWITSTANGTGPSTLKQALSGAS